MPPRVRTLAIVGAGPAGLTLAAILAREAPNAWKVSVFERSAVDCDQGSGWDLNQPAQAALTRAGVDVKDVQRAGSDTMRFFRAGESTPSLCIRWPDLLTPFLNKSFFMDAANQETERGRIIAQLIAAARGSDVSITHNVKVCGLRSEASGSVSLLGDGARPLGTFDAVVDASGTAAILRRERFTPASDAFFTERIIVQGVVYDPEASWDPALVSHLGEGTLGKY